MFKYRTIVKVIVLRGVTKRVSHLLLTDSNDFQVDLSDGCIFNEFPVLSVLSETRVNSLNEVFKYCNIRNLNLPNSKISKEGLLAGGNNNLLINQYLEGVWQLIGRPLKDNWSLRNNSIFDEISDFIIKKVQTDSILSGFQYIISFNEIEEKFGIILETDYIECIFQLLCNREEVAEVDLWEDSFDVTLYTYYAPNYCEELEEIYI